MPESPHAIGIERASARRWDSTCDYAKNCETVNQRERETLQAIRNLAAGGWVVFTDHALDEMQDERTNIFECLECLREADSCRESDDSAHDGLARWVVEHETSELELVCEVRDEVIVVTVYGRT